MTCALQFLNCSRTRSAMCLTALPVVLLWTNMELISHSQIQAFLRSARFRKSELPVETAMCDNFKGWGNFSETAFEIDSNVCFPHATGNAFTFTLHSSISNFIYFGQQSPPIIIRKSSTSRIGKLTTTFMTSWSASATSA